MKNKVKELKTNKGFIRYFTNTSWMLFEQILRIIAGLFVGIWVARNLGPEQFGVFSYVLAFTAIFGGIAKLGLDGIVVRELVNFPEKRDAYLGTAFWLKVVGAMLVIGLIIPVESFTSNDSRTNMFISIITVGLLFQSFEVIEFYYQSQVMAKIIAICKVTQLALSSVIKIYLVLYKAELIWFVLITVFDIFSLAVSYIIAYKINQNGSFYRCFSLTIAKHLIKDSWPLMLSAAMILLYMKLDQLMIKNLLGDVQLGHYSAALKISDALVTIPTLITASLFPAIILAKKNGKILYEERMLNIYRLMVFLSVPFGAFISYFSNEIILIFFGSEFVSASEILRLYVWMNVFLFLQVASSKWYMAENFQKLALIRNAGGLLINIVLNSILIPLYGLVGAAIATLISYSFSGYLADLLTKNTRKQFLMKTYALLTFYKLSVSLNEYKK